MHFSEMSKQWYEVYNRFYVTLCFFLDLFECENIVLNVFRCLLYLGGSLQSNGDLWYGHDKCIQELLQFAYYKILCSWWLHKTNQLQRAQRLFCLPGKPLTTRIWIQSSYRSPIYNYLWNLISLVWTKLSKIICLIFMVIKRNRKLNLK